MAARSKFTRIPKVDELILAGATPELIPTYCAISDYANNKNGLCSDLATNDPAPVCCKRGRGSERREVMRGHPVDMALLRLDFETRMNGVGIYGHPAFPIFIDHLGAVRGLVETCSLDTAKERGWLGSSST